jgi:hypothetical protein
LSLRVSFSLTFGLTVDHFSLFLNKSKAFSCGARGIFRPITPFHTAPRKV